MKTFRTTYPEICSLLLAASLILTGLHSKVSWAQETGVDFEIPEITTKQLQEGILGKVQSVEAIVSDNKEIKFVRLYYRFASEDAYSIVRMQKRGSSNLYVADIPTIGASGNQFQYYINALDTAGNAVFKGYSFSPLIWQLLPSGSPGRNLASTSGQASSPQTSLEIGKKRNVLYYVLGALAVGALVGLAASDDSGPRVTGGAGDPGTTCGAAGCTLTITTVEPGN